MTLECDVCIVGAGPAGLSLAAWLSAQGIETICIERNDSLALDLRASTFHPSTLDMLDELGVVESMKREGVVVPNYQIRDRQGLEILADFQFELISDRTKHPYRLQFEQHKLTPLLAAYLENLPNNRLLFSTSYTLHEAKSTGVVTTAEGPDGPVIISSKFLVGADGVGSAVRTNAEIEYEGFTYPERFFSMSTPFRFEENLSDLSYVTYIADPREWCLMLRTPELWRLMFPVPPDEDEKQTLSDEATQGRLQGFYRLGEDYEVRHRTLYRVQQRVAETYRRGRVILVGDAAHANNPLGGMGLNSGVHDAYNLKNKLLAVLEGSADETLLDTYSNQRRMVSIEHVNKQSAENKKRLEASSPEARKAYREELENITSDIEKTRAHLLRTSLIESLDQASRI
ncbi:MAG: pentachlorophenol monooxygenase [Rhizobiaceae bacterium MnEN-MB40S]|nr:MAG: pentachlorophenol monooxygenase [Rhizobiaceae bacterium MnEN-MB40S]